ncbi:hypothetical protein [Trueperella bonasi]|uniref:hypothetical protein n=1 Tax=Trueperella bonasi TaxID=312286 RepID=UPI003899E49D
MLLYPTKGPGRWGSIRQIGHGWNNMSMMTIPGDVTGDGHDRRSRAQWQAPSLSRQRAWRFSLKPCGRARVG